MGMAPSEGRRVAYVHAGISARPKSESPLATRFSAAIPDRAIGLRRRLETGAPRRGPAQDRAAATRQRGGGRWARAPRAAHGGALIASGGPSSTRVAPASLARAVSAAARTKRAGVGRARARSGRAAGADRSEQGHHFTRLCPVALEGRAAQHLRERRRSRRPPRSAAMAARRTAVLRYGRGNRQDPPPPPHHTWRCHAVTRASRRGGGPRRTARRQAAFRGSGSPALRDLSRSVRRAPQRRRLRKADGSGAPGPVSTIDRHLARQIGQPPVPGRHGCRGPRARAGAIAAAVGHGPSASQLAMSSSTGLEILDAGPRGWATIRARWW